jgi:hypothetical protein
MNLVFFNYSPFWRGRQDGCKEQVGEGQIEGSPISTTRARHLSKKEGGKKLTPSYKVKQSVLICVCDIPKFSFMPGAGISVVPKGSHWPHAEWVECLHRQITYLYPAGKGSLGS